MPTPRQLLLDTLRLQPAPRIPWVPFVGCHAASLIGQTAETYLQSADAMVAGLLKAAELYRPDGLPVAFDLQLEAEALGAQLLWSADNPPAVKTHPLAEGARLEDLKLPTGDEARIPLVLETTRRLRAELPDVALYGLLTGPFTLAMHLAGPELFVWMYEDPETVERLLAFCGRVGEMMIARYIEAGCDVIALVDPMTSQIGPESFAAFVTPVVAPLYQAIRDRGRIGSFFVCGHAQKNMAVMCQCRPENVSIDENIPLEFARNLCLGQGVSLGGNLRLTTVLLMGTPETAAGHAADCMEVGGSRGFVLSPGCDIPYAVPPENLQAVAEVVHDDYRRGIALELFRGSETPPEDLFDLSEYGRGEKVIVDVITLDSESCAPCQYMVESVRQVAPEFEDLVLWREHKIKRPEGVTFMKSLMVHNVPTICIDGEIRFVSRIPPRDELVKAIQQRINQKLRMRIRRHRLRITLVAEKGTGLAREAEETIRRAISELGVAVDFETVNDPALAHHYGASALPAIIMGREELKSSGAVPEVGALKEWIKDLME
jgi:uroporphyrinogen decarboxylase